MLSLQLQIIGSLSSLLIVTVTSTTYQINSNRTLQTDDWFNLFYTQDQVEHPCSQGEGEYGNKLHKDRWYTCEIFQGIAIMKSERVCPRGTCYNKNNPFKCDKRSCTGGRQIDTVHVCEQEGVSVIHPTDPTRFYNCDKDPVTGEIYYAREERCNYGWCSSGNPHWPCGEGFDFCPIPRNDDSHTTSKPPTNPLSSNHSTGQFKCLKRQTETADAELSCKHETLTMLNNDLHLFVQATAHRGSPVDNYRLALRDTHLNMRENYAKLIYSVGRNIFPLIVSTECENPELCGVGGTYKLYLRDGSMKRMPRVPLEFETYKALSHLALGIFTIVSPYFHSPNSIDWIPELRVFQNKIQNSIFALPLAKSVSDTDRYLATKMLYIVNTYIEDAFTRKTVESSSYHAFANQLAPYIDKCMQAASSLQAKHIIPALNQWKLELGDEEWRKTYVIITTVWPVSKINVRLQMFEQVMDFDQIKQQVLIVEGARNEDDAITTLGRIVADRALGLLVFGGLEDEDMKDHAFSISTRRDLLSTQAGRAIQEQCSLKSSCPITRTSATMTK